MGSKPITKQEILKTANKDSTQNKEDENSKKDKSNIQYKT